MNKNTSKTLISLEILTLVERKLTKEELPAVLKKTDLQTLKHLDLSHNHINQLHREIGSRFFGILEGMPLLEELNLSNNPILSLHLNAFSGLINLKILILENSNLSKDSDLRAFRSLKNLIVLSFKNHLIHSLTHNQVQKSIGPEPFYFLRVLDFRAVSCRQFEKTEKDESIVQTNYPNLRVLNGQLFTPNVFDHQIKIKKQSPIKSEKDLNLETRKKEKRICLTDENRLSPTNCRNNLQSGLDKWNIGSHEKTFLRLGGGLNSEEHKSGFIWNKTEHKICEDEVNIYKGQSTAEKNCNESVSKNWSEVVIKKDLDNSFTFKKTEEKDGLSILFHQKLQFRKRKN